MSGERKRKRNQNRFNALLETVQGSLKETEEGTLDQHDPGDDFNNTANAVFVDRVERSDNRERLLSRFRKSSRKR
jgi:hypothetical protein